MNYQNRVLLIERQSLFTPFLTKLLEESGATVVSYATLPHALRLRQMLPDVVCIDVDHLTVPPFDGIRGVRHALPSARIVAYTNREDRSWYALARTVGADVVLGPDAQIEDFAAAAHVRPSSRLAPRRIAAEGAG